MYKNAVFYQLALRTFTPEGTLKAAEEMIPYLASLEIDYIYLCPMFCEDADEDRSTWGARRKAAGSNNPKSPYKIKDYFHVDEEFGTDEDLKSFAKTAHEHGLKIMYDLVYLHCGRNAVFIKEHPDWVEQDENGNPRVGERWPLARINFANHGVREYLKSHMLTLIREYGADGFRADCGDMIPLDFWRDAIAECRAAKDDLVFVNEGDNREYLVDAFDLDYSGRMMFSFYYTDAGIKWYGHNGLYRWINNRHERRLLNHYENHDIATDEYPNRQETIYGADAADSVIFWMYFLNGCPMLWNGNEISDTSEQNMHHNRFHAGFNHNSINWSNALREKGQRRLKLVRTLNRLRHENPMLLDATVTLLSDETATTVAFEREKDGVRILCVCNASDKPSAYDINNYENGSVMISQGVCQSGAHLELAPYGFLAIKTAD